MTSGADASLLLTGGHVYSPEDPFALSLIHI